MFNNHGMYSFIILFCSIVPSFQMEELKLHRYLLKDHTPFARPVHNSSNPIMVTFGFELVHIVSIDESTQTITQKVWLRMSWLNEFMKWDPNAWGGIKRSRLDFSSVWTPDIFLQEDVSSDMSTGPQRYKTQIVITSKGIHYWYVPALFQSSCSFNVASFPFDKQTCTLLFTPWTHDQSELDLKIDTTPVITKNYLNSSEWDLISVDSKRTSRKYACCPNPYVDIKYTINLRRKPLYYVYSVIVPCVIQMIIVLFTFFLPPDSGERIGVVITVLLVFAVYLEVLSHNLPRTSTSTPALSKFYIAAMAESACSLIATCLVLIFHFKATETGARPMPRWAKKFFVDDLASFLCIRHNIPKHRIDEPNNLEPKLSYAALNNVNGDHQMDANLNLKSQDPSTMDTLVEEVRVITTYIADQNKQEEVEEEWLVLGKVFDRIFFFMFCFIFFASSLILLYPVYDGH